jgi:hypothetical protein
MTALVYRLRIWLANRLIDLVYVIAPQEVRRERHTLHSHRRV